MPTFTKFEDFSAMTNSSRPASGTPQDVKVEVDLPKEEAHEVPEIIFDQETMEREKKLLLKIDLFLLPTIWLVYLLSYMVGSHKPQRWPSTIQSKKRLMLINAIGQV